MTRIDERIENHLESALETDNDGEKHFHIRAALQIHSVKPDIDENMVECPDCGWMGAKGDLEMGEHAELLCPECASSGE